MKLFYFGWMVDKFEMRFQAEVYNFSGLDA